MAGSIRPETKQERIKRKFGASQPKRMKARGVGTIFKETASAWHITSHSGCGCDDLAVYMDSAGPDLIERNIEAWVDKVLVSIKQWKATGNLIQRNIPLPPRRVVMVFLEYCIQTSRKEALTNV